MPAAWEMYFPIKIPIGSSAESQMAKKVNMDNSTQNQSVVTQTECGSHSMCKSALTSSVIMQTDKNSAEKKLDTCKYADMRNGQTEQILSVLQIMMDAIGVETRSELATRAGLAHTTLTRIDADDPKPKWVPSAKTWIALSKATGVPVTFLGDKIVGGGQSPGQSHVPQDPLEIKFRNFVRLLGPQERKLLVAILDTLADKMIFTKRD